MEMDEKQLSALVVNTVREAMSAKNAEDEMEKLKAKNAELEEELKGLKGEKEEKGEAGNSDEEKKDDEKEAATLENAKPSQALVSAFATAFNTDFGAKTPSFSTLAALSGIVESDPAKRIAAVNAKFAEIGTGKTAERETESTVGVF